MRDEENVSADPVAVHLGRWMEGAIQKVISSWNWQVFVPDKMWIQKKKGFA